MKMITFTFLIFCFSIGFAQPDSDFLNTNLLVDRALRIDELLGLELEQQQYNVEFVSDTPRFTYGNRLSFNDSLFFSYYTAPCGNDYFTNIRGLYRILGRNILEINIQVVEYHGEWNPLKPEEYPTENWQRFKVIKSADGFLLKRI